jgi:hypothetical protein
MGAIPAFLDWLFGRPGPKPRPVPPPRPTPPPTPAPAAWEPQDLVDAFNVERARVGMGPLRLDLAYNYNLVGVGRSDGDGKAFWVADFIKG